MDEPEVRQIIKYHQANNHFTLLLSWLFAFSGLDFPIRLPLLFFFAPCFALKAKGLLFFFIGI